MTAHADEQRRTGPWRRGADGPRTARGRAENQSAHRGPGRVGPGDRSPDARQAQAGAARTVDDGGDEGPGGCAATGGVMSEMISGRN